MGEKDNVVEAMYDFEAVEDGGLSFGKGDLIQVLNKLPSGWWDGVALKSKVRGWFPSNYVKEYKSPSSQQLPPPPPEKSPELLERARSLTNSSEKSSVSPSSSSIIANQKLQHSSMQSNNSSAISNHTSTTTAFALAAERSSNFSAIADSAARLESEELPENWGVKTTADGRQYYFNMLTNETKWSMSSFNTSNSDNKQEALNSNMPPNPNEMLSSLLKEIEDQELEDEYEDGNDDTGILIFTWPGLAININTKIASLATHIKEKAKDSYAPSVADTVMAIHIMLHSSNMAAKNSSALQETKSTELSELHSRMLRLTAKLIMQSKVASALWPPPLSEVELQEIAGKLGLVVVEFSKLAQKLGMGIRELGPDELFNVTSSKKEDGNGVGGGDKSNGASQLKKKKMMLVPKFTVDGALITNLEGKMVDVATAASAFSITHQQQQAEGGVGVGKEVLATCPLSRPELVKKIQTFVRVVGDFLAIVDQFPFLQCIDGQVDEFKVLRVALLNAVTELVTSTKLVVKEKTSTVARHQALCSIEDIVDAAKELVISIKFLMELSEEVQVELLKEIITSKNGGVSSTSSFPAAPASPMSPNLLKSPLYNIKSSSTLKDEKYDSMGPFSPTVSLDQNASRVSSQDILSRNSSVISRVSQMSDVPNFLSFPDWDEKEVALLADGQGWKAASLQAYICKLSSHLESDDAFTSLFLASYRTFTTSTKMVRLLIQRFTPQVPQDLKEAEHVLWADKKVKSIRFRVYMVLKSWLETFMIDEKDDWNALEQVEEFAGGVMKTHMAVSAAKISQLIENRRKGGVKVSRTSMAGMLEEIPRSILPKHLSKFKLMDLDPVEFARQITLYETDLFTNLSMSELVTTVWTGYATKNVSKVIIHSKTFGAWVAYSILQSGGSIDSKKRAKNLGFFIAVAQELVNLRNFNSLSCILYALDSRPVKRLVQSWSLLTSKQTTSIRSLLQTGASKLFHEHRSTFKSGSMSSTPSCIPLFSRLLNEFEGVKKNFATRVQDNLYSLEKLAKCAELAKEFRGIRITYQLHAVAEIKGFLQEELSRHAYTDDELIQLSMHVEPVNVERKAASRPVDQKTLGSLLGNTGL